MAGALSARQQRRADQRAECAIAVTAPPAAAVNSSGTSACGTAAGPPCAPGVASLTRLHAAFVGLPRTAENTAVRTGPAAHGLDRLQIGLAGAGLVRGVEQFDRAFDEFENGHVRRRADLQRAELGAQLITLAGLIVAAAIT